MVNGKKLVGSAQRRTTNGVLQHGSIPLTGYFRRLPLYLNISERQQETQVRLLQNKCTCIDELQQNLSEDKLAEFLMNGFVKKLSLSWIRQDWSEEELTEIKLIQQSLEYK
jgi:lipoate-protein ligase A